MFLLPTHTYRSSRLFSRRIFPLTFQRPPNYMFVFTDDHKRTYVRILPVYVCFDKPVQRAPDLLYSLSASQGIKETSLEQLSDDLVSYNSPGIDF
jgi:hypothetical protein